MINGDVDEAKQVNRFPCLNHLLFVSWVIAHLYCFLFLLLLFYFVTPILASSVSPRYMFCSPLSMFTYFLRTIEGFGDYTDGLQEVISHILVPAFFAAEAPFAPYHTDLFSLPASKGGLGIPLLKEEATYQYAASLNITSPHVESIKAQDNCLRETNSNGKDQKELRSELTSAKAERLKMKIETVYEGLPEDSRKFMKQSQDKGASSWINAIPIEDEGFNLSKEEFFDSLRLRYNLPLPNLPAFCACGKAYSVSHGLECSKGGFLNRRHDNIRDLFTNLLNEVCSNVQAEPHLTNLSGEVLHYATAIRGDDARLDIKARDFWRRGQDAFFDVRVTHVNAESQRHMETSTIFHRHEQEKKRQYNQRCMDIEKGTFTPLVLGTNGGVGK